MLVPDTWFMNYKTSPTFYFIVLRIFYVDRAGVWSGGHCHNSIVLDIGYKGPILFFFFFLWTWVSGNITIL